MPKDQYIKDAERMHVRPLHYPFSGAMSWRLLLSRSHVCGFLKARHCLSRGRAGFLVGAEVVQHHMSPSDPLMPLVSPAPLLCPLPPSAHCVHPIPILSNLAAGPLIVMLTSLSPRRDECYHRIS